MSYAESSHVAAASVRPPLETVLPAPLSTVILMAAEYISTDPWNLLTQIISAAAVAGGPGVNVVVSPKLSFRTKNGARPWTITAAPSGSNKSAPFALVQEALQAAEAALAKEGHPGIYPDGHAASA